mmetsp:Transcript_12364/g.40687  ORF Transcript_12364/g.40687 Transcript_12364/m.40687 type:complete len:208 (-) Transcript_12364:524-1147(-)
MPSKSSWGGSTLLYVPCLRARARALTPLSWERRPAASSARPASAGSSSSAAATGAIFSAGSELGLHLRLSAPLPALACVRGSFRSSHRRRSLRLFATHARARYTLPPKQPRPRRTRVGPSPAAAPRLLPRATRQWCTESRSRTPRRGRGTILRSARARERRRRRRKAHSSWRGVRSREGSCSRGASPQRSRAVSRPASEGRSTCRGA